MSLNLINISIFEIRFAAHDSDYSYNLIDKEMKDAMYFLYYN